MFANINAIDNRNVIKRKTKTTPPTVQKIIAEIRQRSSQMEGAFLNIKNPLTWEFCKASAEMIQGVRHAQKETGYAI